MTEEKATLRMCTACRQMKPRAVLLRLTVDKQKGEVFLNVEGKTKHVHGRSAYLCPGKTCVEQALKGNKLKGALEGRRAKNAGAGNARRIKWPLEPQLIHTLRTICTEGPKSCHNSTEGGR